MMRARRALSLGLLVAACGGGGDSPSSTPAAAARDGAVTAAAPVDDKPQLVLIDLWGGLPERQKQFDFDNAPTLRRVLTRLAEARRDPRVRTVFVRISSLECGVAVAGEVADALVATTRAGKRVVCTSDGGGDDELLVSTGCAFSSIAPSAEVFAVGAHSEALFVKPLLDKLGLVADFEHVGKWKGAAEPLTRDAPSPELAETYRAIADAADHALVDALVARRGIDAAQASAALDRAPLGADEAVAAKLYSEVAYAEDRLATEGNGLTVVEAFPHARPKEDFGSLLDLIGGHTRTHTSKPHVAVVPVVGTIVERESNSPLSEGGASATELVRALDEIARNDAVKAVVLRISSPGGSATASDLIWRAVARVKQKKPVIASMGAVAASGGYYIASGAQKIYATPATVTGSIGVVGGKLVLAGLLDKLGVKTARFGARKHAHAMSPFSRFSPDERAAIVKMMEATYRLFVDRVATGRKLAREDVLAHAEGRVWTGAQARGIHLVDEMGGFEAALAEARNQAGLGDDTPVEVYPGPKGLFELLARSAEPQISVDATGAMELALAPPELRDLVLSLPLLAHEAVWALAPQALIAR